MSWFETNRIFTCKDCPNRYPGCHGKCEKYQKERAEWDRIKAASEAERDGWRYVSENAAKARSDRAKYERKNRPYRRGHWN